MSAAVELRNVSFAYSGTEKLILKDANLRLDYGSFTVLSGVSGEGKTTLLSIINGVIPYINGGKLTGEVYLNGRDASKMRTSERSRLVGSVLQNADEQIVHDRVEDEAAFGCENFKIPVPEIQNAVQKSLDWMSLKPEWATKTLSGGQKQRLITAATLAMDQRILVLDEPLANLDKDGAKLLLDTLQRLSNEGVAILLAEHRLDIVLPYADRVVWLKEGAVLTSDSPHQYLAQNRERIPPCTNGKIQKNRPCLEADEISYFAGGREILKQLSAQIRFGERIVLLGENGCGKTTLLRLLARLTRPTSGTLRQFILPGDRHKKARAEWFQRVGFVYQNPSYQLFMPTLMEEVAYRAVSLEKAAQMIEQFGLSGLENRHPHSLSEGQKRRAGIAAIAAGEPEVILLDEPTVGQDYQNLKNMVESLNRLQAEKGCTMITVTHDFRCAAALADRVLVLEDGRIAKEGGPELADRYFRRNISSSAL